MYSKLSFLGLIVLATWDFLIRSLTVDASRRPIRLYALLAGVVHTLSFGQVHPNEIRAEALYRQYCAQCHGADKQGSVGVPDLRGGVGSWGHSPDSIAQTIRHGIRVQGHVGTRGGVMPSFKTNAAEFSDDEVAELVEYILRLRDQPHDAAIALRGKENFEWCVACHGQDARGSSSVGGSNLLAPRLQYGFARAALFESIAQGRAGVCPSWVEQIDAADIDNLARYLARIGEAVLQLPTLDKK